MVLASIKFEYYDPEEPIIHLDCVSRGIYFIYDGHVDVHYKDRPQRFLKLDTGSYFGDISYIFKNRNQYSYFGRRNKLGHQSKIFSLTEDAIEEVFTKFLKFKNVMKIRALRRQHYFKKLKNFQEIQ